MRFLHAQLLWLLALLPFLVAIYWLGSWRAKRNLHRLGASHIRKMISFSLSASRRRWKVALIVTALGFMTLALARPQYGTELVKVKTTGVDVMIALDVSLSMLAEDFYPHRLQKAKREIISLIERLPADNVGLVLFSGQAFVQCPLTSDHSAFKMFLDIASVGIISDTGTDIERAIEKAAESFSSSSKADKVLVIFTDGEQQKGDAVAAARKYGEHFRIFTVGVGTPNGEPIPLRGPDGSVVGYKKDRSGQPVVSKLNQALLAEIAAAGGGISYLATPGEQEIDDLAAEIRGLRKGEGEGSFRRVYEEKFQYFLLPGIILTAMASFLGERKEHVA